jgi:hypothetical protein
MGGEIKLRWRNQFLPLCFKKIVNEVSGGILTLPQYLKIPLISITTASYWGTRWRSWLRHCATKVAGSIPDYVIGIFH